MKLKIQLFLLLFLSSLNGIAQISYSGFIGKQPITFVSFNYSDDDTRAFYVYNTFDSPIKINGKLNHKNLELFERNLKGEITASLIFTNYNENDIKLNGIWKCKNETKSYKIVLKKDFEIEKGDAVFWEKPKELLQINSTEKYYFKTVINKEVGHYYARVSAVKVFEKITDKLFQTIKLDCELLDFNNVTVDDYNFDGLADFSVFESFYAGPNTSSIYILKKPGEDYFISDIKGVSLEFDKELKLIYEHNQSRAGYSHSNSTYKLVDNKMILIKEKCIEFDKEKDDFIDVKCN